MPDKMNARLTDGTLVKRREARGFAFKHSTYLPRLRMPPHAHELASFSLVLEGSYTETLRRRAHARMPSTLTFRPPEETHAVVFDDRGVRIFSVEVGPDALGLLRQYARGGPSRPVDFRRGETLWLAARLYKEFLYADEVSSLAMEGLALELLAETARRSLDETCAPRWLTEAKDLLRARFTERFALGEIAATVGVHPVHLARVFRQQLGCTVGEYVRQLRIESACRQLSASHASLSEIAATAGFSDQSHFCRVFKQETGQTPAAYRRSTMGAR